MKSAVASNRPVLLDFSARWCGPCRQMAQTTLRDEKVAQALQGFVCASVDVDFQPELARAHGVTGIPCFVILHPGGDEVLRTTGMMNAERFIAWLDEADRAFAKATERMKVFQEAKTTIAADLLAADPARRGTAIETLYGLCCRREESERKFAVEALRDLVRRDAGAAFGGLNHSNLAVRIEVSNAFRSRFGDQFRFDPWEKPADREAAMTVLKADLRL